MSHVGVLHSTKTHLLILQEILSHKFSRPYTRDSSANSTSDKFAE